MALDQRDYMNEPREGSESHNYDPKQFRGHTRAPGEELFSWQSHRPPQRSSSGSTAVIVVVAAAALLYFMFGSGGRSGHDQVGKFVQRATAPDLEQEYRRQQASRVADERARWEAAQSGVRAERQRDRAVDTCGGQLPNNSGFWMHEGAQNGRSGQWFRFTNMLGTPVFLDIKRAGDDSRLATAFIMPGESSVLSPGVARIAVTMSQGTAWCNGLVGWRDGRHTRFNDGLGVEPAALGVTLEIRPGAGGGESLALLVSNTYPNEDRPRREIDPQRGSIGAVDFPSGQSAAVMKNSSGGYVIAGHINAMPVTFLVDTGATITSVPDGMGGAIGITQCERRTFWTANGQTIGCVAVVGSIDFGPFRVRNAEVALMKNLHTPLLGMNALKGLQLVKVNGSMALQRP